MPEQQVPTQPEASLDPGQMIGSIQVSQHGLFVLLQFLDDEGVVRGQIAMPPDVATNTGTQLIVAAKLVGDASAPDALGGRQ